MVDYFGRRPVLVLSSIGVLISMAALGTYFYLDDHLEITCPGDLEMSTTTSQPCIPEDGFSQDTLDSLSWLPLTSLFLFKFAHSLGLSSLPGNMLGEFFSSEAKDVSSTVAMTFGNLCAFLISKFQVYREIYMCSTSCKIASILHFALSIGKHGRSADYGRPLLPIW